jgi:cyclopropane-fatty-acyl-phospholipid synthase
VTDSKEKQMIETLLQDTDIKINGDRPWDIQVHNKQLYKRLLKNASLGLGEAYMDGWWDCEKLDEFFFRIFRGDLEHKIWRHPSFYYPIMKALFRKLASRIYNYQSRRRAHHVGRHHYDLGNDLFQKMLDKTLCYSCGYWLNSDNLADAQLAKLRLVCEKLQLKPGMHVLDIGCGWGSFAKFAAENYGVSVLGVTVSKEQALLAEQLCKGLPVTIKVQDYRTVNEKFDSICSIGMFEHVGYKNYDNYMRIAHRCLKEDGLFLLHTIGNNISNTSCDEWISKYIFPNGMLPSIKQISHSIERRFVMEDWHNFGSDYDKTLMAWHENFNSHWQELKPRYDDRFYRMWNYYLLACAAAFRARAQQLWQIVLAQDGVLNGYQSVR